MSPRLSENQSESQDDCSRATHPDLERASLIGPSTMPGHNAKQTQFRICNVIIELAAVVVMSVDACTFGQQLFDMTALAGWFHYCVPVCLGQCCSANYC